MIKQFASLQKDLKMKTKILILLHTLLFLFVSNLNAQKIITGFVTDPDGNFLAGVSVLEKGTTNVTVTDLYGEYSIKVSENAAALEFSMIGLESLTKKIDGDILNVTLSYITQEIGDIIIIGYGTQKNSDRTGAVAYVENDDFDEGVILEPIQAVQGKISGVVVTKKGGDPNTEYSIKIRNSTGLYSETEPLFVVDGVPGVNPSTIAPEDIESINVLKDASSTAIYGARGANGVVFITTKKGLANTTLVEINTYYSFDYVAKRFDLLSATELRQFVQDNSLNFVDGGADVDWQNEVFRTGHSMSQNVAISGGTDKISYRASLTHNDFDGVIKGSSKTRDIGRIFLSQKGLNNKLTITANISGSFERNNFLSYKNNGKKDIIYQMIQRNPTDPVFDENGDYYETNRNFNYYNPVGIINQSYDLQLAKKFLGNLKTALEIIDGLNLSLNLGYIRDDDQRLKFESTELYGGHTGRGERLYNNYQSRVLEATLNYKNTFDKHYIDAIAGYSYQHDWYDGFSATAQAPTSNSVGAYNLGLYDIVNLGDVNGFAGESKLISFFGRIVYNYDSKYYITATVRRDGSSRFGTNNQWGLFPSASIAWNISRESFMRNINFISDFKLRLGYGFSGNQSIGDYINILYYSAGDPLINPLTGQEIRPYELSYIANPNLKWEENREMNLGWDFGFFRNKITGAVEYYDKTTYNLIAQYSVPVPPNPVGSIYFNGGTINNKGIEVNLQAYIIDLDKLKWKTLGTFTRNLQKVISLSTEEYDFGEQHVGWIVGNGLVGQENWTQIIAEGYELGTFYLPVYAGISEDGQFLFQKENGGVTRDVTEAQRQVVGSALPKFTLGWSNYFQMLKYFDLGFSFRCLYGNKVFNATRLVFGNPNQLPGYNALRSAVTDYNSGLRGLPTISDFYLEDASFIRLENVSFGYSFNTTNSSWIKKIRVYVASNNVYTFTNYTGIDPEINLNELNMIDYQLGVDLFNVYPKTRTLTFGLNFIF